MKQYIKKLFIVAMLGLSTNVFGTDFAFTATVASGTYGAGSTLTNWTEIGGSANPTASDFLNSSNRFSCNGKDVNLSGLSIGNITFINSSRTIGSFVVDGTLSIESENPPSFLTVNTYSIAGRNTSCTTSYQLALSTSTIHYNFSSSTTAQKLASISQYKNVTFSNSDKIFVGGIIDFTGTLTENSGRKITADYGFVIGPNATFSVSNSTKFSIPTACETLAPFLYMTDYRTSPSRNYPGIWEFADPLYSAIPQGVYNQVILAESCILDGNTTFTNGFDYSKSGLTLELNSVNLTTGAITNSSNGKFIGNNSSGLTCSTGTYTIYFDQTSTTTSTLKQLTITGGASITLGNSLNIAAGTTSEAGSLTVNTGATLYTNNLLKLKSDANNTARIGESTGTINGRYYAERYFPSGDRDYRFICAPVKGATALQWRANGSSTTGIGIHITGANGSTDSFDATTANKPSAFYYDEANAGDVTAVNSSGTDDPGWQSITMGGHYQLTNGTGFRVLIRGDRRTSLTTSNPSASATTITSYGSYPRTSGSGVLISVTNHNRSKTNDGMNLIGNPYPSAINWNAISISNVDNGYALYNPTGNRYEAWNGSLGDATQYISSGQAFFVFCNNSSGGSLTIDENDKYDGRGGNFFLEKLSNHMRINLMYDSNYNSNAFIHFRDDASDVKDVYDIQQFYVNGTNIASLDKNGKPYKINSLKTLDSLTVVPLSIAGTPEASLKLSFYDVPSFYGYKLELVDTYLKKTVEITEGMIYNLDITSDSFTVKDGRFYINIAKIPGLKNRSLESNKIANIYPNPIQDKMAISLDKKITQANYEIFNSIGQLITKGTIESPQSTINTSSYSNGTYYLIVKTNNSSQTIQFVK